MAMKGMLLETYLAERKIKAAQFAVGLRVPASTITRAMKGQRKPGLELLEKISKATNGLVRAEDFFGIQPPPEDEAAA